MATTQITPVFSILQPPAHKRASRQIDGTPIPPTLEAAVAQGFESAGHNADSKSLSGNVETLRGVAFFKQCGLDWLECPVTVTMTYDWSRLRANQRTSKLEV